MVALLLALSGCKVPAAEQPDKKAMVDDIFVQAFMGSCVLAFPDTGRIEAAAKMMKWKPVTDPSMRAVLEPINKGGDWKAWGFKRDKRGYMVAVGDNVVDGRPVKFCSLASEVDDPSALGSHLATLLKAVPVETIEEGGQRARLYKFEHDGGRRLLNLLDAEPMNMKMLNATVFTDWKPN